MKFSSTLGSVEMTSTISDASVRRSEAAVRAAWLRLLVLLVALPATSLTAAADNLLRNPSFEYPSVAPGNQAVFHPGDIIGPGDGTGWTVMPNQDVSYVMTAGAFGGHPRTVSDGLQACYITDHTDLGTLSQVVHLDPTVEYHLAFDLYEWFSGLAMVDIDVRMSGVSVLPSGPVSFVHGGPLDSWQANDLRFSVSSPGDYLLTVTQPAGHASIVDNFSLVPTPSGIALLGLSGLLAIRRRR